MIPKKLKAGSHIRVCSPSRSMNIISQETRNIANDALKEMGLSVSYSKHAEEAVHFNSGSITSRVADLNEAFADKKVDGILTTIGGFNSNQLLPYLNYKTIKKNPKIFCGYSDITALNNAIYAKTGLVNYSGAHYSTFGMKKGNEYTKEYFKKCLFEKKPFEVMPSKEWSDDSWWMNQEARTFIPNEGYKVVQNGKAKGTLIGGNLCTFILLHGTEFMPSLKNSILFLEDDQAFGKIYDVMFERHLHSILQQPDADKIKGIVIGRPQKSIDFNFEKICKIISTKKELANVPVISGADFGHTYPVITFPIGGKVQIETQKDEAKIRILEH